MSIKNKSEDKKNEVFTENTAVINDTVVEDTETVEVIESENMNADKAEIYDVSVVREYSDEKIRNLLGIALDKDSSSPIGDIRSKRFVIPENIEKYIAISGDVTGGKSTFLNALCCYPICPSAVTTTSICPVELRRVSFKDKERIEICFITKDGKSLSDKSSEFKVFSKQTFSPVLFDKLCVFVDYLIEKRIIKVDSLIYFKNTSGSFYFDRNNWRHTMVLLMVLFDTYLHEDKSDSDNDYKVACQMKKELFIILGLKDYISREYGIRLYWCSDLVPAASVIVDLPGTSSATEDSLHTKIVNSYLAKVSSLLFMVDLTGNISLEAQTTIDLFLNTVRSQRRDMPELVTFLMNKADLVESEDGLQTAIKAFRDNYKKYDDYALYAISSISGEWLFVDSGIEPEKTFRALKYRALDMNVGSQLLCDVLEKAYKTKKYPFSLNGDDLNYNSASLSDFVGEHIEEYIRKLNFRGTINLFDDYIKYLSNLCRTVTENIDILINASGIGGKIGEELTKAVLKSLQEANDNMSKNRTAFVRDIETMRLELLENIVSIYNSFSRAYEEYNRKTNDSIFNFVQLLEVENGRIPIDGSITGANQKGLRNQEKMKEFLKKQGIYLAAQLTLRDSRSTFSDSFNMLEEEFDSERKVYNEFLERNMETLLGFADYAEEKMNEKFKKILSDNNIPEEYFKQTEKIISNVCRLLKISCEEFSEDLYNDMSFDKAIIETSQKMHDGLSEILRPYTKNDGENYALDVLNSIKKFRFFRASSIDMDKLKDFLSEQYISDFASKFERLLVEVFTGDEETRGSHTVLLDNAIRQFNLKLSKESMEKLSSEAEKACILLKDMGQSEEIGKRLTQYIEFAEYIKAGFAEDGHYRDIIDYIDAANEPALKESRDDFAAIENKADSIIKRISDFKKVGDNNG